MRSILPALVALLFPSVLALGQNGPLVLGVDYARPAAFRAARGQVITVFVSEQPNSLSAFDGAGICVDPGSHPGTP